MNTCDLWIENAQASFKGTCCLEKNCPVGVLTIHFSVLIGTVLPHLNCIIGEPMIIIKNYNKHLNNTTFHKKEKNF